MGIYRGKIGILWSAIITLICTVLPYHWDLTIEPVPVPLPVFPVNVPPPPDVVEDTIQKNGTLVATLVDYDIPVAIANQVADLIKPVFDVRRLRFGNA